MPESVTIENFLNIFEDEKLLLLDARSEKEFDHAHIPGAVNIPLLNNDHRHLVGIEYKNKGREAAVALGFKLVGPLFYEFIEKVNGLTDKKEVMVYCWRGGMRSSILSWVLSMAGFKVILLKGGYKSFRNLILDQLKIEKKIIILGGHTGSGKTDILKTMGNRGEQIIDLEGMANHRGSAFGQLGLPPQPTNEFYENLLGCEWRKLDSKKRVWLEAESHSIGQVKIPDDIFIQLQNAPLMEVCCSREFRKERILAEYGEFSKSELAECTTKLRKRLGQLRLTEALFALEQDRMGDWLEVLIDYYDKTYSHSLKERNSSQRISVKVNDDESIDEIAKRLINESSKVNKNLIT